MLETPFGPHLRHSALAVTALAVLKGDAGAVDVDGARCVQSGPWAGLLLWAALAALWRCGPVNRHKHGLTQV